jgi:hypothetical protein
MKKRAFQKESETAVILEFASPINIIVKTYRNA